ncbi:hypothetical protein [Treponema phagedenis]|uniref:Anti-bacteriophage protein A/HamA C-terminal domain-containing protein n=3 Tax=Treponema phagedenis TaxID=162 RepID=A0A0B7GVY8_TREPH|nr:hypothetical protein [Treponema phagedenis]CEM62663.1 conserved hypothetical protein [Treponema phagedenis]
MSNFNVDTIFKRHIEQVNDHLDISVFEVEKLSAEIQQCLDENLISICEGKKSSTELELVKARIVKLFEGKNDKWKMGAIAEFFIHLYMKLTGYTQECMFLNLEEGSIKKGFDGLYSFRKNHWVMESKSGSISSKNICHKNKLQEAILDLKNKFEGKTPNNPWQNAYNHASHCDVGTPKNIKKSIKKLSDEYTEKKFYTLSDFNIIPCATIFLDTIWKPENNATIIASAKTAIENTEYKCAHLICVTQGSIDIFIQYITT